jgi:hypothetical protein
LSSGNLRNLQRQKDDEKKTEEAKNTMELSLNTGKVAPLQRIKERHLLDIKAETFKNLAKRARLLRPQSKYCKVIKWLEDKQTWKERVEREEI